MKLHAAPLPPVQLGFVAPLIPMLVEKPPDGVGGVHEKAPDTAAAVSRIPDSLCSMARPSKRQAFNQGRADRELGLAIGIPVEILS
jgi:hypothetical protein